MNNDAFQDLVRRYTAAWCSHDPTSVASFFAEDGSLAVSGQGRIIEHGPKVT